MLATIVFVVTRMVERRFAWVGFLRAAAEAGMVGGLADWFAVTALFRHPLGIPIPHTALIPERKNELGAGLGAFVQENFLSPELVVEKVRAAHPSARITQWLAAPDHRTMVADRVVHMIELTLERSTGSEVSTAVASIVERQLASVPASPILAALIEGATADGRHQGMVDSVLDHMRMYIANNADVLRARVSRSSPWWIPGAIDDKVFSRIVEGVLQLLSDMRADHRHVLRQQFDGRLELFVKELRTDPQAIAKAEAWKHSALAHPAVREWMATVWDHARSSFAGGDFGAPVHTAVGRLAHTLAVDADMRTKLDEGIEKLVAAVVRSSGHEVVDLIATTVARWDGDEAARRIEGVVGRDLQFIRINGTVVGSIAGVLIYTVGRLIG